MRQGKPDKASALHLAFFHAARHGDKEVVELLLEAGADIHFLSDIALRGAAEFGQTEMVMFLLQRGADVHTRDDSPLRLAKKNHHKQTAAYLKQFMKFAK